jgi:hypothetical protein
MGPVGPSRDYLKWHDAYDDPGSGLPWRLRTVQGFLRDALDRHPGRIRVVSLCSGDGRDVLGVLSSRPDAHRVSATLIEIQPDIARMARIGAASAGGARITVKEADAGNTASYAGAVPADVVIMVGIFGNISDGDLERTVRGTPQLCAPGATLLWSRATGRGDRNGEIREWFTALRFDELEYVCLPSGRRPALGVVRYQGTPQPLVTGRRLFTFER